MRTPSLRRLGTIIAGATLASLALSGCVDVTYNVSVNPDTTVSGSLVLSVNKQAAKILGISSASDLDTKLKSGELSSQTESAVVSDCSASETSDSLSLNCAFSNLQVTDVSKDWSITSEGDSATLHVVTNPTSGSSALPSDMGLGTATLNISFPGEITAVSGGNAKQTGANTVVITSDISAPIDVTVTGVVSSGSSLMWLIYVGLGLLAVIVVASLVLVLRRSSAGAATAAQQGDADAAALAAAPGAIAAPDQPSAIEAADVPEAIEAAPMPDALPAPQEDEQGPAEDPQADPSA